MKWFKFFTKIFLVVLAFFSFLSVTKKVEAASVAGQVAGKILIQVEAQGQAYYVNPLDLKKYYLGRPADAFSVMRSFGLGVKSNDLNTFLKNGARSNLSGRILLQVEAQGQAYYVNPDNLKLYYLGRPIDAFNVMRELGLGITDSNLNQISTGVIGSGAISSDTSTETVSNYGEKIVKFTWKYNNKEYFLNQTFYDSWYNNYKNSPKYYSYSSDNPPADLRDSYYSVFLVTKTGDTAISDLISNLKKIAQTEGFSDDEFLEFTMALVQYIPYDFSKNETSLQNFPYETLYKNSGICSDKSFLALSILRYLGYGGAIFDYPDIKHSAVAVACSGESSYNSGYCFIETTNYFPVGIFPSDLSSGQATSTIDWNNIFEQSSWGEVKIYQKTSGRYYFGMAENVSSVNQMKSLQAIINQQKSQLDTILDNLNSLSAELNELKSSLEYYVKQGDVVNYNANLSEYNTKVAEYNLILSDYYSKVDVYNNNISSFNKMVNNFWQT